MWITVSKHQIASFFWTAIFISNYIQNWISPLWRTVILSNILYLLTMLKWMFTFNDTFKWKTHFKNAISYLCQYICGKNPKTRISGIKKKHIHLSFWQILHQSRPFTMYNFKIILLQLNLQNIFLYGFYALCHTSHFFPIL